jgi:Trypsin-like peptidase domain
VVRSCATRPTDGVSGLLQPAAALPGGATSLRNRNCCVSFHRCSPTLSQKLPCLTYGVRSTAVTTTDIVLVIMLYAARANQLQGAHELIVDIRVLALAMIMAATLASTTGMKAQTAKPQISYGTAFAVTEDGDLVTNEHVVSGCNSVDARLGSNEVPGVITVRDQNDDLALIRLGKKSPRFAVLRNHPEVRAGDAAITFGFPLPGTLAHDGNLTVGYVSALRGASDNSNYIQVTTPIQPGNSGGPLLDNSGNVIGVVAKRLNPERFPSLNDTPQLVNFAVGLDVLRNFLNKNKIRLTERDSNQDMRLADVGDQARLFSYSIRCAPNDGMSATSAPGKVSRPNASTYERAVLYEEDLADGRGRSFVGSVAWRVETSAPEGGRSPKAVLHGDIQIPGGINATLTVRESLDETGLMNCRIEVVFDASQSPRGEIVSAPGLSVKSSEQTKGIPILARSIQTSPSSFLLLGKENYQRQNLKLLREQAWIDLPVIYKDGHRAIVALSKGVSGRGAFNEVLAD